MTTKGEDDHQRKQQKLFYLVIGWPWLHVITGIAAIGPHNVAGLCLGTNTRSYENAAVSASDQISEVSPQNDFNIYNM